jgi:hypothetical protein
MDKIPAITAPPDHLQVTADALNAMRQTYQRAFNVAGHLRAFTKQIEKAHQRMHSPSKDSRNEPSTPEQAPMTEANDAPQASATEGKNKLFAIFRAWIRGRQTCA